MQNGYGVHYGFLMTVFGLLMSLTAHAITPVEFKTLLDDLKTSLEMPDRAVPLLRNRFAANTVIAERFGVVDRIAEMQPALLAEVPKAITFLAAVEASRLYENGGSELRYAGAKESLDQILYAALREVFGSLVTFPRGSSLTVDDLPELALMAAAYYPYSEHDKEFAGFKEVLLQWTTVAEKEIDQIGTPLISESAIQKAHRRDAIAKVLRPIFLVVGFLAMSNHPEITLVMIPAYFTAFFMDSTKNLLMDPTRISMETLRNAQREDRLMQELSIRLDKRKAALLKMIECPAKFSSADVPTIRVFQ